MPRFPLLKLALSCVLISAVSVPWTACGGGSQSSGNSSGNNGSGSGDGGGSTPPPAPHFLLAAETTSAQKSVVEVFKVDDSTGALTAISDSPFDTSYSASDDLALAPSGSSAYVLAEKYAPGDGFGPASLLAYSLDASTGKPALKNTSQLGLLFNSKISVHPNGKYVYISPYTTDDNQNPPHDIGLYSVQSDGSLSFTKQITAQTQDAGHLTQDGKYFYTHVDGQPVSDPGDNPCAKVYVNLYGFKVDSSTGDMTAVSANPTVFTRDLCWTSRDPSDLLMRSNSTGTRLYAVDIMDRKITTFSIDPATGELALLSGETAISFGSSALVDASGKFFYVGGVDSFTGFAIDHDTSTGELPLLPAMPVQTSDPNDSRGSTAMAIDPATKFLYSNGNYYTSAYSCCEAETLLTFKVDSTSGAITQQTSNVPKFAGSVANLAITPTKTQ